MTGFDDFKSSPTQPHGDAVPPGDAYAMNNMSPNPAADEAAPFSEADAAATPQYGTINFYRDRTVIKLKSDLPAVSGNKTHPWELDACDGSTGTTVVTTRKAGSPAHGAYFDNAQPTKSNKFAVSLNLGRTPDVSLINQVHIITDIKTDPDKLTFVHHIERPVYVRRPASAIEAEAATTQAQPEASAQPEAIVVAESPFDEKPFEERPTGSAASIATVEAGEAPSETPSVATLETKLDFVTALAKIKEAGQTINAILAAFPEFTVKQTDDRHITIGCNLV
jgi:hypothetical protein